MADASGQAEGGGAGRGGAKRAIAAPKGTRDLYPEEMLKRRYLLKVWRDVSIRHGFEEVDGPTFETTDLYAVKSGEGILGELFQAYSGKSPEDVQQVQETGRAPFAMRPEFTPTLARMYAARAGQAPKPCKWFMIGPFFRAERPQRGRLREFLQWNADFLGDDGTPEGRAAADAESLETCVNALAALGLSGAAAAAHVGERQALQAVLRRSGVGEAAMVRALELLDRRGKVASEEFARQAAEVGLSLAALDAEIAGLVGAFGGGVRVMPPRGGAVPSGATATLDLSASNLAGLVAAWPGLGLTDRCVVDFGIVRGLAYYTGTVFEVIAEGERAIAGGGRYDNLIELLGGPATPAVGFAMGDVVVSLLLEEKGLMPQGAALLDALSSPGASLRPDAFVVTANEELDGAVRTLVATLRRGEESAAYRDRGGAAKPWDADRYDAAAGGVPPLHARRSYKSTRNVGKLIQEAAKQHARAVVIVESAEQATVKHLDTQQEVKGVPLAGVGAMLSRRG